MFPRFLPIGHQSSRALGYDNVHNSDAGGASMNYNLSAGSHNIEFAYREEGTIISKIYLTTNTETEGVGLCFD